MTYTEKFLLEMQESIGRTGMYMPQEYWVVYGNLRTKCPEIDTGFADKNMALFIEKEMKL